MDSRGMTHGLKLTIGRYRPAEQWHQHPAKRALSSVRCQHIQILKNLYTNRSLKDISQK